MHIFYFYLFYFIFICLFVLFAACARCYECAKMKVEYLVEETLELAGNAAREARVVLNVFFRSVIAKAKKTLVFLAFARV